MSDPNAKIVFAEGQGQGDGARFLLLGIPEGAWEYMKDGKTHTFDLTKIGLPVKLILYGAKDHDAALEMIKDYLVGAGQVALDLRSADFSISPGGAMATIPPSYRCFMCNEPYEYEVADTYRQPGAPLVFGPTDWRQKPHTCPEGAVAAWLEKVMKVEALR